MEDNKPQNNWLIEFDPLELLAGRTYYAIGNQIMFEDEGKIIITQISEHENYTVSDYLLLPENAPYQLIHGKLVFMAAPRLNHQRVLNRINTSIFNYIDDKELGEIFVAPTDVQFDDENMMQPDILFVSIKRKLLLDNELRVMGAPDFVVEILSKGTEQYDRTKKMMIYGKYEVVEYWIVNIKAENIEVYHNKNKEMYLVQTAEKDDTIQSKAIDGFKLDISKVFK